jgi:hypothetical protein
VGSVGLVEVWLDTNSSVIPNCFVDRRFVLLDLCEICILTLNYVNEGFGLGGWNETVGKWGLWLF